MQTVRKALTAIFLLNTTFQYVVNLTALHIVASPFILVHVKYAVVGKRKLAIF